MECFFIIKNICKNLIDLNKHNLVHNDIKPPNIVRKSNGIYSLIDFSLCSTVLNITDNYLIHTLWYRSLEVLTNSHNIDYHKADIWSTKPCCGSREGRATGTRWQSHPDVAGSAEDSGGNVKAQGTG